MVVMDPVDIRFEPSVLGPTWSAIYSMPSSVGVEHFRAAMTNIIRQPNINSSAIMRADILEETVDGKVVKNHIELEKDICPTSLYTDDVEPHLHPVLDIFEVESSIVRRIIPRNPLRDPVINQSCTFYTSENALLLVYVPHLKSVDEVPYYLPPALAVGLLYRNGMITVHYAMFDLQAQMQIPYLEAGDRTLRTALRLVQTSWKHSRGVQDGYQKRVHHDVIVDKVAFQDHYFRLKMKYSKHLVENWQENTDPKKHVFEDLAIASFLIVLWEQMYKSKDDFQFVDMGCGNGLLVNVLIQEGYKGKGIDARARKSWRIYPQTVQDSLLEQVVIPRSIIPEGAPELEDPFIDTAEYAENTFVIGNHSDELTVWIPLLGYPFMVIPCCSHALSGARHRYPPKSPENKSQYAALVDHVEEVATAMGWIVEKERLRIPSTRNAALIGRRNTSSSVDVAEMIRREGGAEGWIERTTALKASKPRSH